VKDKKAAFLMWSEVSFWWELLGSFILKWFESLKQLLNFCLTCKQCRTNFNFLVALFIW